MSDETPEAEFEKIIQVLGDPDGLRRRGIDEEWVRKCRDLASEYRALRTQFLKLEAELSESDTQSPGDTVVF